MAFANRTEVKHYLKIGGEYKHIGRGVLTLDDSRNPGVETSQYIMDKSSTSTVDRYEPQWSITMHVDATDPVAEFIREVGKSLAVGEDAETTLVEFDAWEMEIDQTVPAMEYKVAVAVDYIHNGEAGAKIEMSAVLHGQGDPVPGTFDLIAETFTQSVS